MMDYDKYKNKMVYPARVDKPRLGKNPTPDRCREYADDMDRYKEKLVAHYELLKPYNDESMRLEELFWEDAIQEAGLMCHIDKAQVKAAKAFAWSHGHANGFESIFYWLLEAAEILNV